MNFLTKNKIFILGLISALAISLQQFVGVEAVDWMVVAYAGFVAVGSYLAKNLRGQWQTITGLIIGAIVTIWGSYKTGGHIDFGQIILAIAINLAGIWAPPAKTEGYEESPVIQQAKAQAATIDQKE